MMEQGLAGRQLAERFIAALRDPGPGVTTGASPHELDALAEALPQLVDACRSAWPDVSVVPEHFIDFLAARVDTTAPSLLESLRTLCCQDLWLVHASMARDARAVQALTELHHEVVRRVARELRVEADVATEVLEQTQSRLWLGGPQGAPALSTYGGRGSLAAWLRMMVLRETLQRRGERRRHASFHDSFEDKMLELLGRAPSPEAAYLKEQCREALRAAFRAALSELDDRDRALLRYQLVDRLASEEIAKIYDVNPSTLWRWMTRLQTRLAKRTKLALGRQLRIVDPGELDSILRTAQSQLSITMSDLLARPR